MQASLHKLLIIWAGILFLGADAAAVDILGLPPGNVYCVTSGVDVLTASPKSSHDFEFIRDPSTTGGDPIVSPGDGTCTFDPAIAGPGSHQIVFAKNIPGKKTIVNIEVVISTTTFALTTSVVCVDAPAFLLDEGEPTGGSYSGTAVAGGEFYPSTAGAGTHDITYTTPDGCSATDQITVEPLPVVTLAAFDVVCEDAAAFPLSGGSPAGGNYSGPGVSAGAFNPSVNGPGTYTITYTYDDGTCTNSASEDLTVDALPSVSILNLNNEYCLDDSPDTNIEGDPLNGSFSGPGISDNGDGTATFYPGTAGYGIHTITYTYTNSNGCTNSVSQNVTIGTEISITGLDAEYCEDAAVVDIIGTPTNSNGEFLGTGLAVTDNGDGTGQFDPSVAGPGIHTIIYDYINSYDCFSSISQDVIVNPVPTPGFSGLEAAYCENGATDLLTGNYAPDGTFSGAGITDNGDGTATFDPTGLAPGNTYAITYQHSSNGCTAISTKTTLIDPLPTAHLTGDNTICRGSSTDIQVDLTGTAPYDFSYMRGSATINITGHPSDTYTHSIAPSDTVTYTMVSVTDDNQCTNTGTGTAVINVNPNLNITSQPTNKMVCEGGNTTFSVSATGVGIGYQWQFDEEDIIGATNSVLTLNNVSPSDEGDYKCIVSSPCGGPISSNVVSLELYDDVVILTQPSDDYLCNGEDLVLSVNATGSNLTYQWRKDGTDISGENLPAYTKTNASTSDVGTYTCYVGGSCSPLESAPAEIQVDAPIIISAQPTNQTACLGSNSSFTVTATGSSLSYQWMKDGSELSGRTSQSLILSNVQPTDADSYSCVISSPCGDSLNSASANLIVETPPSISDHPVGDVKCEGDNISFEVTATGSNLTYKWVRDNADITAGNASGITTSQLIINSLTPANSGEYRCIVTGSCGNVSSNIAELVVDDQIIITKQPEDKSACDGTSTTLSVIATGSNLNYQWYKDLNPVPAPDGENPTLDFNPVGTSDAGDYECIISNSCGLEIFSDEVTLTINPLFSITSQPAGDTRCVGEDITFAVAADGSNLAYQWYKEDEPALTDGIKISGSTTATLTVSDLDVADGGEYYCNVTSDCGSANSDPAELIVDDQIVIDSEPNSKTVCPGSNTSFKVEASGSNLTYQWQKDEVNMAGRNNPTLSLSGVDAGAVAGYRCVITNSCGNVLNSQTATLSLYTNTAITDQPNASPVCEGGSVTMDLTATGNSISYQWYHDGVILTNNGIVSGATTASLEISPLAMSDEGVYTCIVTGECGVVNSEPVTLEVLETTTIANHPKNKVVCEGDEVSFSVNASGSNLAYQWQRNNSNIIGENGPVLQLIGVDTLDQATYRCIVTGDCGIVNSNGASLTVNEGVTIDTEPAGDEICEGEEALFTVQASGSNLEYQWKFDGNDLTDGDEISGSGTANLQIDPALSANSGLYQCVITGACGSELSKAVNLTVHENTTIDIQPVSKSKCPGSTVIFSVTASGAELSYQWQENGSDIVGDTTSSLIFNSVAAADAGTYQCIVTGACGTVLSQEATLTVFNDIVLSAQPVSDTVCSGDSKVFAVTASGTGLSYQWKYNSGNLSDGSNITGSNSSTLTLDLVSLARGGTYNCEISGTCGVVNSDPAFLVVTEGVSISAQPENITACESEKAIFSVTAEGSGLLYQWQKNGGDISGANSPDYVINAVSESDEATYRCVVTGSCNTVNSNGASLTVNQPATIDVQPQAIVAECEGDILNLSISGSGTGISYQWKKGGDNLVNGGTISGALSSNLFISGLSESDDGVYTCEVSNACGSELSALSDVTVMPTTTILQHPADYNVAAGQDASFSVTAEGFNLSYQWQKDGTDLPNIGNISGANSAVLEITSVAEADEGAYRCIVTGTCNTVNSTPADLIVNPTTNFTSQPQGLIRCEGESASFSVTTNASNPLYQWQLDGSDLPDGLNITGAETANLTINAVTVSDRGSYTCVVNGEISEPAALTVNEQIVIGTHPISKNVCEGNDLSFSVVATGTNLTYQWQFNSNPLLNEGGISGAKSNTLIISNADTTHNGTYHCLITGTCGDLLTFPATLSVSKITTITAQPAGDTLCEGNAVNLSVNAIGDALTYQWKKGTADVTENSDVTGSQEANLSISNLTYADRGSYYCIVSGTCGSGESDVATININKATNITVQPVDINACQFDNVSFTINATGDSLTYQWEKDGGEVLTDGSGKSGATTNHLVLENITEADAGTYRCVVTGVCNNVVSESALLNVFDDPVITDQPESDTLCAGSQATFSVSATGSNLNYQWQKNGADLPDEGNISGSSTATLQVANVSASDAGNYSCLITGNCNSVNSNPASLTVKSNISITKHPLDAQKCVDESISLVVTATGSDLSYEWQKDGTNLTDGDYISGSLTKNLQIDSLKSTESGAYHCIITGYCGTLNSNAAEVIVNQNTQITVQPVGTAVCEGEQVSLSVDATGSDLTYVWKKDGNAIQDTGQFVGSDQPVLNITSSDIAYSGLFSSEVSGVCGSENSSAASVVINPQTLITAHPANKLLCAGEFAIFNVTADGENLQYQWQKDGTDLPDGAGISGTSTNSLTISDLSGTDNGNYRCVVTGDCSVVFSNEAQLVVNKLPDPAGTIAGSTDVCQGARNVLYEVPAITGADFYEWILPTGATIISGDSSRAITVDFELGESGGDITVRGVNQCGPGPVSPTLTVTANSLPVLSAGSDQNICSDQTSLDADDPGMGNGEWTVLSGPGIIADPTNRNTGVNNLRKGENQMVWSVSLSGCTSYDTVSVFNNSVTASAGVDVTLCSGTITLEGNPVPDGADGTWQVISGQASFVDAEAPDTEASGFASGINELRWRLTKSGCSDADTVVINNQTPTAADAGIDQLLCRDSTGLKGNDPLVGTGEWTVVTGNGTVQQPAVYNSVVENIQKGSNIFRWTITNGICKSIDDVTITNRLLDVEAGDEQVICSPITTLGATAMDQGVGTWSVIEGSALFVNSNLATTKVISLDYGRNTLQWMIENNGCLSSDTVTIINDSPSEADAGEDQTVLVDSATLSANDPAIGSGQWLLLSGSGDFVDANQYNTVINNLGIGNNLLRWVITHNTCIRTDEVLIDYYVPDTTDAGPDQVLCADNTVLEANTPIVGFGEWLVGSRGSAIFADPSDPNTAVSGLSPGENMLIWSVWASGYTYDTVTITNNKPTEPFAGADRVLCADSIFLAGNAPVYGTGKWSVVSGSADFSDSTAYNSYVSNLSQGKNTFKWTISNEGCELQDRVNITNDLPTVAVAGENQTICADSTQLYPNTPGIGNGEWVVASGSATFEENNAYALAPGSNILSWTIINNNCSSSDDLEIINNKPTTAKVGLDKVICVDSVSLSASQPVIGTGSWTVLNGSADFNDVSVNDPVLTNVSLGTNVFRWTIEHEECISRDEIEIRYLYEESYAGEDQVLCSNETFLSADQPTLADGYWSVAGGSGTAVFENSDQPDTKVTGLSPGNNILQWTVQNDRCKSVSEVLITNNSPNQPYAGEDQSNCSNTATLDANETSIGQGVWSVLGGSGTFLDTSNARTTVEGLSNGSNTLRWTIENKGCQLSDDVIIFNNSVSTSFAGDSQTICIDSTRLRANLPSLGTGEWRILKGAAIFENQNQHNTDISHLAQGDNILEWYISNNQCSSSSQVIITNNTPSQPIAGSDQDVCGDEAQLYGNTPDIGSGSWSLISGGGEVLSPEQPSSEVTGLNPGGNIFRWSIEKQGCILYDDVVISNNLPFEANAGSDIVVCGPETRLFANSSGTDGTGSWSIVSGNAVFSDPASNNPDVYELNFGDNTLQWTIDFDQCSTSDIVVIRNNKTKVNAGRDQVINVSSTTLVANNPASGTGKWSVIGGSGTFADSSNLITKVNNLSDGINTFLWTVDVNGCLASDEVIVTYQMPAEASFVIDKAEGCPPLDIYFANNSLGNLPFIWNFGDDETSQDATVLHTYAEPGDYKASLTVYGNNNEVITRDTLITVYEQPNASFILSAEEVFIPGEDAIFINESDFSVSYVWDFGDGETSTEKDPFHTYEEEGIYPVSLIASSNMGCSDTLLKEEAVSVLRSGSLKFPNAFTPSISGPGGGTYSESDYTNDVFHPYGEGIQEYHLEIFNKWGVLLFETFDINVGWDGYYKDKLVQEGAYVWKVYGRYNNGRSFSEVGTVMVLH